MIHEKSIIGARRQQQGLRRTSLRGEGPVRAVILDGILSAKIKDLNPLVESRASVFWEQKITDLPLSGSKCVDMWGKVC